MGCAVAVHPHPLPQAWLLRAASCSVWTAYSLPSSFQKPLGVCLRYHLCAELCCAMPTLPAPLLSMQVGGGPLLAACGPPKACHASDPATLGLCLRHHPCAEWCCAVLCLLDLLLSSPCRLAEGRSLQRKDVLKLVTKLIKSPWD